VCVCVPQPLRYPFANIHSLLLARVPKNAIHLYDSFICRHDLRGVEEQIFCLNDARTAFSRSAESPMNGWERIPHTLEITQSCSVRETQSADMTFQEHTHTHTHARMCYYFRIRGEQCSAELGFRHWFLASPQAGLGKLCRFVWLPLWFLCERPLMKIPMLKVPGPAPWCRLMRKESRTITSQPQHMSNQREICVCTHVCVLRSRCAATLPISSA